MNSLDDLGDFASNATLELKSGPLSDAFPKFEDVLQLTYAELRDTFLATVSTAGVQRNATVAVNKWLEIIGKPLEAPVGFEFGLEFESSLINFRGAVGVATTDKNASNLASILRAVRAQYLRILKGNDLPATLADAIKVALAIKGLSAHSLRENFPESVYHWAVGNTTPKRNSSLAIVHQLEEFLDLPRDSLAVRAHKVPVKVQDLSKDIPWRRYMAIVKKHPYRLKEEDAPLALCTAVDELVQFKRKNVHMLPSGNIVSLKAKECWNSDATVKMRKEGFWSFFGFLVLPMAPKANTALTWEQHMQFGMGLKVEDLRFTMLLNRDYLFAYVQYSQMRTYDKAHFEAETVGAKPGIASQKTVSSAILGFIVSVNNLLNKPHSFLRLAPSYAQEVGVALSNWQAWLDEQHTGVLAVARHVNNRLETGKRSNKEVVQEMLRMENPMELMFKMLDHMRADIPPRTAPMWYAVALRDIALVSLLTFDPLRLQNFSTLELGRHLKENKQGRLTIEISAWEFKNYIHGHAESRFRVMPLQVEADLRAWLEVRKNIVQHQETNLVFTAVQNKPAAKGTQFVLSRNAYYEIMRKNTTKYFGLHLGTHAIRTLMATTVAKHGTPQQVKSILNDSEAVAMEIYRDERNQDQFQALDDIYEMTTKKRSFKVSK